MIAKAFHNNIDSFSGFIRIDNFNYVGVVDVFEDFNLFRNRFLFLSGVHSKLVIRFDNTWQSICFPICSSNFCECPFTYDFVKYIFLIIDRFTVFDRWKPYHFFASDLFQGLWWVQFLWFVFFEHFLLNVYIAGPFTKKNIFDWSFSIFHYPREFITIVFSFINIFIFQQKKN